MTKIHLQPKLNHSDTPVSFESSRTVTRITNKLFELESKYPGILQGELLDFMEILVIGAEKYALNNWLDQNGKKCSEKEMHDSMFHHLAESFTFGMNALDEESGKDPLLHLACRALMLYTRRRKGIIHQLDE